MNPDTDVTYRTVNLFSFDKCFINYIFNVPLVFNPKEPLVVMGIVFV